MVTGVPTALFCFLLPPSSPTPLVRVVAAAALLAAPCPPPGGARGFHSPWGLTRKTPHGEDVEAPLPGPVEDEEVVLVLVLVERDERAWREGVVPVDEEGGVDLNVARPGMVVRDLEEVLDFLLLEEEEDVEPALPDEVRAAALLLLFFLAAPLLGLIARGSC